MKILFLTFLYLEKTSGISKKIQAQGFISVTLKPWRTDAIGHWMAKTSDASEAEKTWF